MGMFDFLKGRETPEIGKGEQEEHNPDIKKVNAEETEAENAEAPVEETEEVEA